jgi:hypothetical protein
MTIRFVCRAFCVALLIPIQANAQITALDPGMSIADRRDGWLPYAFATEALGTAVGVAGFSAGNFQPQSSFFATGFVTSNDSWLASAGMNNVRLGDSRSFLDTLLFASHFTDQRFYGDYDQDPNEPRAGSNDSNKNDYITGTSDERTLNITYKYRLPIGGIEDDPIAIYRLDKGLLNSGPRGGDDWNPMASGQTTFGTRFFFIDRDLKDFTIGPNGDQVIDEELLSRTSGLDVWLEYDNTEFPRNPSRGSRQLLRVASDFGWFDGTNTWTNIQLDLSKYLDLGDSGWFRQQVMALNFWTSITPTWTADPDNPTRITNRPPPRLGSSLGGFDRLRAYPGNRFHDKAAVYYAAELRLLPRYQPLRDLPVIRYFEIDWWQVVPFLEVGRVGPEFDADLFTKDLKWSAGIGLRFMAFRVPVRLDFAASDEGSSFWAMIQQPFSRQGQ